MDRSAPTDQEDTVRSGGLRPSQEAPASRLAGSISNGWEGQATKQPELPKVKERALSRGGRPTVKRVRREQSAQSRLKCWYISKNGTA